MGQKLYNFITMHYVYILKLRNGKVYVGYSSDLRSRIKAHKQGKVQSTKNLRPLKLIFYAAFSNKKKALDFERYLKSSSGHAFRKKRLI